VVGSRLLDDGGGCEELLKLFEDFFTSVIPNELGALLEQLDHRSRSLGQAWDESGEGSQAPQELLYLLDAIRTSHAKCGLTFVGVSLYPPVGKHEA